MQNFNNFFDYIIEGKSISYSPSITIKELIAMSITVKRIISIILLVTIAFSIPVVGYANGNDDSSHNSGETRFTTINTASSIITKSGITVTCSAILNAKYSTNLKIVMILQKSTSSGWTDVKTWTKTGTGTRLSTEETRVINILYTYRLKVTFTAGSESITTYAYY